MKSVAARFNRMITIERPVAAQDATYGSFTPTWEPIVWQAGSPQVAQRFAAEVQDVLPSRNEALKSGVSQARNQARLRMRWRNDINSSMRVTVHGDTDMVYQIIGGPAEIGGRRDMIEMMLEQYSS